MWIALAGAAAAVVVALAIVGWMRRDSRKLGEAEAKVAAVEKGREREREAEEFLAEDRRLRGGALVRRLRQRRGGGQGPEAPGGE